MEYKSPPWLDKQFLTTVLQGGNDKKGSVVKIVKYSVKPAVDAGNNYGSNLFRVYVEYKLEHINGQHFEYLIVKAAFEKSSAKRYFNTEGKIYNELLPKLSSKINYEFGPKSFYSPSKDRIVLKDMNTEGFIMCDKRNQLDFAHCKIVLMTLAKYHAASVACHHENPQFIETLGEECLYKNGGFLEEMIPWLKAAIKQCAKILNEIEGQSQLAHYFLSRVDNIWESVINICKPRKTGLNVLNHGDCWINNILFKHNDCGEVVDIKLIDYAIPRYTTPVLDLIFFLWSSANEDVRENKQEELYSTYLQTLNKALEDLECEEKLTYRQLHEDSKSANDFIILMICYELPLMLCEPENAFDMDKLNPEDLKFIETNDKFKMLFYGKTFSALLPIALKQYKMYISS